MTINLSDNSPRISYTVASGVTQSSFTVPFEFFEDGDLNAYVDGTLKTITTDYTVTGGSGATGSIAMTVVGASGGSTVVITRSIPLERTTDFPTSGPFDVTSLNEELDRITAINADLNDEVSRSLRLTDADAAANLILPDLASRAGKVLAFDAVTGDLVNGPSTAGVTTVAAAAADIATLADIQDGTVATNAITDAAAIASNISTVSGIAANVTTTAGNTANVNTVAGNTANISTVAGIDSDVTTVSGISGNVTTAAGISADITAVAADATDIGTVSTNIANVNTVAGISADVSTVAADGTDIGVVAGISSDVTTVSGIAANVTTVAGNTSNMNAVAADATNIGTVATNIANVNTAAGISANITTVAGISADVTAAATNASDISAIAAEVAKVVTVANDLNEATSEIDVVSNNITNVNLVGADIANVNTVASNLSGITAFSDVYASGATDPTTNLNEGDLFFNTTSDTLKVYDGSAWVAGVTAGSGFLPLSGGQITGNLTFSATQTVDGRDVSVDGAKLDGIEASADVTDATNVIAAGAAMLTGATFTGAVTATSFTGDGANLTNLPVSAPTLSSLGIANHDQVTVTAGGAVTATSYAGDGSALTGVEAFAAGTKMLFGQTAAPTGWTKITTDDDAALRIVSGTVGSGGSSGLSTALATPSVTGTIAGSTGSHTLTTSEIPSHQHSLASYPYGGGQPAGPSAAETNRGMYYSATAQTTAARGTGATGSGGSHSHSLSATFSGGVAAINVKYVDAIMASKD